MAAQKIFGIELVIPDHKNKSYNPPISVDDVYEVIDEILIIDDSEMSRVQMYKIVMDLIGILKRI